MRPDQVWSTDITSVRLSHGFAYLVAIIDGYSRRVLGWWLSNTLEASFCVDCPEEVLRTQERPEICNSCWVPDDYIGTKIGSLLRAREVMELLVSMSIPENAQ